MSNPSGNLKYGNSTPTNGAWVHDLFHQHEKEFESGYGSNSNSTNGSFMQGGGHHGKGKKSYYSKKNPESNRHRPPLSSGSFKAPRDRERDHDFIDKR